MKNSDITIQVNNLPLTPGVYIFKNQNNDVIYVGKAVKLKNRVSQYFRNYKAHSPKVRAMIDNISSFEYILTDNEMEALILECNLIKKYRPKYNILLRDDKTYPYIKVTLNEDFPRVLKVRRILNDGAKYFGPYTNISGVNETLNIIFESYPIRTCNYDMKRYIKSGARPCLEYYMKKCVAPCNSKISKDGYKTYIDEIIKFLSGNKVDILKKLETKMISASKKQDYENAIKYRDKIQNIEDIMINQKISSTKSLSSKDVIAVATNNIIACVTVFFIRAGRVLGRENFILEGVSHEEISTIISEFIAQYYSNQKFIPNEILVEDEIPNVENIMEYLYLSSKHKVNIKKPSKGEKAELIKLVKKNAIEYLDKFYLSNKEKYNNINIVLNELKRLLELDDIPERIESFDISHIQGVDSVGAMVVYKNGKKDYKEYRRYKIKSDKGNSDTDSISEIIERRLKYGNLPNLILVDGGRNQVNAVTKVLSYYGLNIEVWGMAKDNHHRTDRLINHDCEVVLNKTSSIYKFIAGIQEEVHRYAISYHRSLRTKNISSSVLDKINGIGEIKKRNLLDN